MKYVYKSVKLQPSSTFNKFKYENRVVFMYINEISLYRLIRSLTFRRLSNLALTTSSFFLSALLRKNILWGRPAILTIEPTNLCNLRCPLCITGSGDMERPGGQMSLETFGSIMDKMGDDLFFLLLYHQGEPYLNRHFLEFVRLAKEKNIYCTTSSNAHYFSDDIIHATIDSGLDSMIVSLDGVTQNVYEKYRVKGELDKVLHGVRRFMEIKKERRTKTPVIALQFLVMRHNEHQLTAVKKIARELKVDRLLIKNIEVHTVEEAREWLPEDERYRRYEFDGESLKVKNAEKQSCPRPWTSIVINWDGNVVPCCFDKNGEYLMGNINTATSIEKIWTGQPFRQFRQQLASDRKSIPMCRNCNQGMGSFIPAFLTRSKNK